MTRSLAGFAAAGLFLVVAARLPARAAQTAQTAPVPPAPRPPATAPALVPAAPGTPLPAPPAWDTLRAAYAHKPAAAPVAASIAARADADYLLEHVSLTDAATGKAIPGLFLRPKASSSGAGAGAGAYPVVLLLHGLGSNKETMMQAFGRPLAARGFACLALDARDHGERKPAALAAGVSRPAVGTADGLRFALVVKDTVGDYRFALDYLQTRPDVDSRRVGLLGYSMGAMMGAILGGVDERVKALVLEVGGDPVRPFVLGAPPALRAQVETISPSNYVGHIAPRPLLMINAKADQTMKEDAARRLQQAAREPKQIIWAEGGHILAPADAQKGVTWLVEKLSARP